jgi:TonB family protein
MRRTSLAFVIFLCGCTLFGQSLPKPRFLSGELPLYPPLARQTKIQGEVKIEFSLNANGEPDSVVVVSGHPFLQRAAEDNVRSWRFEVPTDSAGAERKYSTTFNFKFYPDDEYVYDTPKLTVHLDSFEYVEVITTLPSNKTAEHCPSEDEAKPPVSINDGDFVKLSRWGCYGTCPAYELTITSSGDVTWEGKLFVNSVGTTHSKMDPDAAHELIARFQEPRFWKLCANYSTGVTDSATTDINLRIGGKSKSVSNYADSAPAWVEDFEKAIDAASNSHEWRHGDAKTEPLSNISQDSWLPKPGVTPLMRAARKGDVDAMKEAIADGAEIDAADASGWTALMYGAMNESSEPVELLLKAGANPNHRSFAGDTPLMAAATDRDFDEELSKAGADINAKNKNGVSALMILAAEGEGAEVKSALDAGADAFAKDAKGRTPLDYLRLADCGKSPVENPHFMDMGGCKQLDRDEVQKITSLLKSAKRKSNK